jgi:FAD/FMN-containing dehydrogenase
MSDGIHKSLVSQPGGAQYSDVVTTPTGTGAPNIVVRSTSTVDVQGTLRYAQYEGMPVSVQSSGHRHIWRRLPQLKQGMM